MIGWLLVLALSYAAVRWTAVNVALRIALGVASILGLAILLKVGFIPVFLAALVEIPVNFAKGVVGIVYHLLAG